MSLYLGREGKVWFGFRPSRKRGAKERVEEDWKKVRGLTILLLEEGGFLWLSGNVDGREREELFYFFFRKRGRS